MADQISKPKCHTRPNLSHRYSLSTTVRHACRCALHVVTSKAGNQPQLQLSTHLTVTKSCHRLSIFWYEVVTRQAPSGKGSTPSMVHLELQWSTACHHEQGQSLHVTPKVLWRPCQARVWMISCSCLVMQDVLVEYVIELARKAAGDKSSITAQDMMWVLRKVVSPNQVFLPCPPALDFQPAVLLLGAFLIQL